MTTKTPGRTFYDDQIALLEGGQAERVVAHQYHDDAQLVGFDVNVKGREALIEHFRGYLAALGSLKVLSTDKFTETDDAIFFEATVRTDHGVARVYDVFMLRDGKATHHFTGLISVAPLTDDQETA